MTDRAVPDPPSRDLDPDGTLLRTIAADDSR